jgi:hypothetical protein
MSLQDPQTLCLQVASLSNVLDDLAGGTDAANIPRLNLGNIVPVLKLLSIRYVINQLLRDVRKGHPWQLLADGHGV